MSTVEVINLVAVFILSGFVSMIVVNVLKAAAWAGWVKMIFTLIVCGLVGTGQAWVSGDILGLVENWGAVTAQEILMVGGVAFAGATAFYQLHFRHSAWMLKLEALIWGPATP